MAIQHNKIVDTSHEPIANRQREYLQARLKAFEHLRHCRPLYFLWLLHEAQKADPLPD